MPNDQASMFFNTEDMDPAEHYPGIQQQPLTPLDKPANFVTEEDLNFWSPTNPSNPSWPFSYQPLDQHQLYIDPSSFGSYDLPPADLHTAPSSYAPSCYTSRDTTQDWAGTRNGSVSTANTSIDSPTTEFSFLGAQVDDTTLECVPELTPSPSDSNQFSYRPGQPTTTNDYFFGSEELAPKDRKRGSIAEAGEEDGGRSKRSRSGGAGTTATTGMTTRSKEKPTAPAGNVKAERRKSTAAQQKSSSKTDKPSTAAATSGPKAAQLRTASRKPKEQKSPSGKDAPHQTADGQEAAAKSPGAGADDDDLTPDERRARHSHNLVEKQYRNRLNKQFEDLLNTLNASSASNPTTSGGGTQGGTAGTPYGGGKGSGKGFAAGTAGGGGKGLTATAGEVQQQQQQQQPADDRRLSKAEVLDMARRRILSLTQERDRFKSEKVNLEARLNLVSGAMVKNAVEAEAEKNQNNMNIGQQQQQPMEGGRFR
ncbi:hypothetical protein GE09DRAFT_648927 [Coniochaeta sp. 2T2.1]|nr:hypothetical protein GE09DRAFT_648927 [Coniochaeta sp. 2T2.1]